MSIFCEISNCSENYDFVTRISIFHPNFDFLTIIFDVYRVNVTPNVYLDLNFDFYDEITNFKPKSFPIDKFHTGN